MTVAEPLPAAAPCSPSSGSPVLSLRCDRFVVSRLDRGAAEPEGYHGAVRFAVGEQQPPAVAGGDRLGDPKPEPAAGPDVAVTAEVALKLAGRAEAAAGVADADLDRVPGD